SPARSRIGVLPSTQIIPFYRQRGQITSALHLERVYVMTTSASRPFTSSPKSATKEHVWPHLAIRKAALALLLLSLASVFLLSIALGSVSIPLKDILAVLTGGQASQASWTTIILNFRLPESLTAVMAGAALAVSGLQMQTF